MSSQPQVAPEQPSPVSPVATEWLRRSRTLLYDAYWPPFHPHLDYRAADGIAIAQRLGANVIRFGTCGKWALYPSAVMPPHPELGSRDLLDETVTAAHAAGIKVVAYVPVGHGLPAELLATQRPQWRFILDGGTTPAPIHHFGAPALGPVCPFGPYRADLLAMVREVVSGYAVDALYLDGPYYAWIFSGICQCAGCATSFRAATGLDLPRNAERTQIDDAEISHRVQRHRAWVASELVALIRDIRAIARTRDLPLLLNGCAAEYLSGAEQQAVIDAVDGFLLESHQGGIKGVGRGVIHHKLVWNYTHRHNCWNRRSTPALEADNALAGHLAVAQGATPIVSYAGRFFTTEAHAAPLQRLFSNIAACEADAWDSEAAPWAAVIAATDLQPTEGWAKDQRRNQDANLYAISAMLRDAGVQQVAMPHTLLAEPQRLAAYAVVVLAGVSYLDAASVTGLRAYVAAGGGLVVTGDTPRDAAGRFVLGDLFGCAPLTPDPALSTVLAAHRWDQVDAPWDVYLKATVAAPAEVTREVLPVGEFTLVQPQPGAEVLAELVLGSGWQAVAPGVVSHRFGRGRAVYIPTAIELTWESPGVERRDRGLSGLLAAVCDHVARTARPYRLTAPTGVFSNLLAKPGCGLLHLVDQVPEREQVTCSVTLPTGVTAVRDLFSGQDLHLNHEAGRTQVTLTWTRAACLRITTAEST
jgi:hypothetical protein